MITFNIGDKVQVIKSRNRRKDKVTGEVVDILSDTRVLVYWPYLNMNTSYRTKVLKKV
jgi:RNase P/RNase MRP subunit p29